MLMDQLAQKVKLGTGALKDQPDQRVNMVILEALAKLVCMVYADHRADKGLWVRVDPRDLGVSLVLRARMVKLDLKEYKGCLEELDLLVTRDPLEHLDKMVHLVLLEQLDLEVRHT